MDKKTELSFGMEIKLPVVSMGKTIPYSSNGTWVSVKMINEDGISEEQFNEVKVRAKQFLDDTNNEIAKMIEIMFSDEIKKLANEISKEKIERINKMLEDKGVKLKITA